MSEEQKQGGGRGRGRGPKKTEAAAAAGNETAAADKRPKTAGRGGKRGGAQGGAAEEGKKDGGRGGRRPQTARQAANAAEEKEETKGGQDNRKNDNKDKKGPRQNDKQQDKNSWIYKYHNMDRVQYEKIAFTADTVVPEIPSGKDRLKEPVKAEFDRAMQDQDALIATARGKKDSLIKQKRLVREGGSDSAGTKSRRGELTERINTAKGIRANKRKLQDQMREISDQIEAIDGEKRGLIKGMHPQCHTVESVNQEIKDLEYRMSTSTISAAEETRTIKEIKQLKESIPKAKRFSEIEPSIKELKSQKNKIWAEVKKIRSEEDVLNGEMEKIRKQLEQTDAEKDQTRAAMDAIQVDIEKVDEELKALYKQKDDKREAYWKGRFDFKTQDLEIQHIQWMQRQKDKVLNQAQYKKEREEEKQAVISSLPHPYIKEIDCCDHLIGYLQAMKVKAGLTVDNEVAAREAQSAMQKEAVQEKLNQKLTAGKVQETESKKDRENAAMVQIGGKTKQKGKKRKAAVEYEEVFQVDFAIIKKFGMLSIAAPTTADDLDKCLGLVEEKKVFFEENGGAKLKEQIDELERMVAEEERGYEQEEPVEETPSRGGRGGRGGRGRGSYGGGRGGASRGRGRGGMSTFQARNAFDSDEDEDQVYSAPVNKQKKNKQKQEDLQVDEDNYPTL